MYQAELRGKLPSSLLRMEDILTSNVFSFFKYSNREIFLKGYLKTLDLNVSVEEARDAEFLFWPQYEDHTEPDLVIIVGEYYLLIEAKHFSDFVEVTRKEKAQLIREINGGRLEAKNYGKNFKLIVITADPYYKEEKFKVIRPEFSPHFKWTNWQFISLFLEKVLASKTRLDNRERDFALDLYKALDKKKLRNFCGVKILGSMTLDLTSHETLFFDARTASFRGAFIGFTESLMSDSKISLLGKTIFYEKRGKLFLSLLHLEQLKMIGRSIFWRRRRKYFTSFLNEKIMETCEQSIFLKGGFKQ